MMREEVDGWYTHHVSVLTTAPYFENFHLGLVPRPAPSPTAATASCSTSPWATAGTR
ncbi:MAG TPA: hypothetical protein VNO31_14725 [Umezawaea sp.]|nr:hypothetical protein [Umezawaea sp.]